MRGILTRILSLCGGWSSRLKQRENGVRIEDTATAQSNGLPPPPRELIANRLTYEMPLQVRTVDRDADTPLAALYRMYEHITLDQQRQMRNEFEHFWYQKSWVLRDLPDPKDPDPERYAVLAVIPKLLCLAFNERIKLGLPRHAPGIFTRAMMEEWRSQEPQLEGAPEWVGNVPPVTETLAIPYWDNEQRDFVAYEGSEDKYVSAEFAEKNILVPQPHIYFI